jgi:16S rRNA processing protein RimM
VPVPPGDGDGQGGTDPGPELLDVGRVGKAHGLNGEVVVDLWTDVVDRLAPGSELSTPSGSMTVRSSRPFGNRFLVVFENVVDRSGADALRGVVLRAPPVRAEGVLWVHELIGCEMVDTSGRVLGEVTSVEPNPASDLLVLESGGLVPLRFVVSHLPGTRVVVDIPEGLLE